MTILEENLFGLIRKSAFGDDYHIQPMSSWKWKHMAQLAKVHNVWVWVKTAIKDNKNNPNLNIPYEFDIDTDTRSDDKITDVNLHNNRFLNNRYDAIITKELDSAESSVDTLDLLKLIVENAEFMLSNEMSIKSMVLLGQCLRTKGHNVDFVKLESWLNRLQLTGMASLEASVLVEFFGFELDEIPFATKFYSEAKEIGEKTIRSKKVIEEWHFTQNNAGFVINNSKQFRRNMKRSLRFMPISPLLASSSLIYNFIHSLKEIEE